MTANHISYEQQHILLVTQGITKRYKETLANDRITVELPRGKIVGFVGENGSGKTTFLRIICGLSFPTEGSFRFLTEDGTCRIGAIVESPAFHPALSAPDNLRLQARLCGADEARIPEILRTVGLSDTGKKHAKNFSLGMRQRLGIAIALLSDPDLLILDEPTNGLDPQGIIELRGVLKQLAGEKDITLLISSHILSELSLLAEHYLFIHKGVILKSMSAEQMFDRAGNQLRFRCEKDAAAFLAMAVENSWAEQTEMKDGLHILYGPKRYPEILKALADLGVTALETRDDSLEERYLNIIQGGGDR